MSMRPLWDFYRPGISKGTLSRSTIALLVQSLDRSDNQKQLDAIALIEPKIAFASQYSRMLYYTSFN